VGRTGRSSLNRAKFMNRPLRMQCRHFGNRPSSWSAKGSLHLAIREQKRATYDAAFRCRVRLGGGPWSTLI